MDGRAALEESPWRVRAWNDIETEARGCHAPFLLLLLPLPLLQASTWQINVQTAGISFLSIPPCKLPLTQSQLPPLPAHCTAWHIHHAARP